MRFSVIMPAYNAEKKLDKSVQSILKQSFSDFELIIVDDGSSDRTWDKIKLFENKDSRVRGIHQSNLGAGAARNTGIDNSKGEYIAFLDSDDVWNHNFLEVINDDISTKMSDVIFINVVREDNNGNLLRSEDMSVFAVLEKEMMIRQQLTGKIPWGCVRKVVKAEILLKNNIRLATTIKVGEESIYSFLVLQYANNISFKFDAIYHYIENNFSLTSNDVPENSHSVFRYINESLEQLGYKNKYEKTINALAVTTVSILINLEVNQDKSIINTLKQANVYIKMYKEFVCGEIDKDSLEWRVKICMPWIKSGLVLPVIVAAKMQKAFRRLGGH